MEMNNLLLVVGFMCWLLFRGIQEEMPAVRKRIAYNRSIKNRTEEQLIDDYLHAANSIWNDPAYVCRKYLAGQLGGIPADRASDRVHVTLETYTEEVVVPIKPKEIVVQAIEIKPQISWGGLCNEKRKGFEVQNYKRRSPQEVFCMSAV